MDLQDLFVGSVSVALGLCAVAAAYFNWDWCYRLLAARCVETRLGRPAARGFYALTGVLLILLGVAIATVSEQLANIQ